MKKDSTASFKQSTLLPWIELRVAKGSSACYAAHSHDEFSFGLITAGTADYTNRHLKNRIGLGDVVTINPCDVHSCNPHRGAWSYQMLFADASVMGQLQNEILSIGQNSATADFVPFSSELQKNSICKSQLIAILEAIHQGNDKLKAESLMFNFVSSTIDHMPKREKRKILPLHSLELIRQRLLDDIRHNHSLDELASLAELSRYQLLRMFKRRYGLPPHAFLIDEKIKRSKVMLKRGQSVSDVAYLLGFSDQSHFQRQFKKHSAVTPKYYQSHFISL